MLINDKVVDSIMQSYFDKYDDCMAVPMELSRKIENINFDKINTKKLNLIQLIKRIIIAILSLLMATGGFAFAKKYLFENKSKYNLGKGIDTAVEYGYIREPNLDSQVSETVSPDIVINDAKLTISINDFLMDDQNISSTFKLEFDEGLLENINLENIKSIELRDLLVTDENNNILYCLDEERFSNFCKENSLNYDYYNSGVNIILDGQETRNSINLIYNICADNLDKEYPKSKEINYIFSKLILYENEFKKIVELNGNWSFKVDIPEIMYNRSDVNYEVVNCPDNIKVTKASASETGFEFGCNIIGVSKSDNTNEYVEALRKYNDGEIGEEEFKSIRANCFKNMEKKVQTDSYGINIGDCTHIKDEFGNVYEVTFNPGRKYIYDFLNENTYCFYETFALTKYDLKDSIFINLVWYNNDFELEKAIIELKRK